MCIKPAVFRLVWSSELACQNFWNGKRRSELKLPHLLFPHEILILRKSKRPQFLVLLLIHFIHLVVTSKFWVETLSMRCVLIHPYVVEPHLLITHMSHNTYISLRRFFLIRFCNMINHFEAFTVFNWRPFFYIQLQLNRNIIMAWYFHIILHSRNRFSINFCYAITLILLHLAILQQITT